MELSVIFNEVSLREPAPTRKDARDWMQEFIETLMAANDAGLETLRIHQEFKHLYLSHDYPISAWYNDDSVAREMQDYLLTYATRYPIVYPHLGNLPADHPVNQRSEAGFTGGYEGHEALGLSYAYMLDSFSISLSSESCWDTPLLEFDRMEETPDKLIDDRVSVRHMARKEHVNHHQPGVAERYRDLVIDGPTLLQYSRYLYPNVVFCGKAKGQIQALGKNDYYFKMVRNEIENIQRYCSTWTGDFFDKKQLGGRTEPESESTLKKYRSQRQFIVPGGIGLQTFSWHTRVDRDWRIHFYPVVPQRKIYVGYVGEHLPISSES